MKEPYELSANPRGSKKESAFSLMDLIIIANSPTKKTYLTALPIVAVVLLMLILIGIYTYRNLNREKKRAMEFAYGHGWAVLRSLEPGVRERKKL